MDGRYVDVYEGRDGNLKVKEVHTYYNTTNTNTHHVYYCTRTTVVTGVHVLPVCVYYSTHHKHQTHTHAHAHTHTQQKCAVLGVPHTLHDIHTYIMYEHTCICMYM
jgi:hypothetical protein